MSHELMSKLVCTVMLSLIFSSFFVTSLIIHLRDAFKVGFTDTNTRNIKLALIVLGISTTIPLIVMVYIGETLR